MAKARTPRTVAEVPEDKTEAEYIADQLVAKVWQGDEGRRGIATQAASVALAAIQDYTAAQYMRTAPQFGGRDLLNDWHNRALLEEARASVALDKGDGETQSIDGTVTVGLPLVREEHWADQWEIEGDGVYRCGHRWDDGTQCDQRVASPNRPVSLLHTRVVPDDGGAVTRKPSELVGRSVEQHEAVWRANSDGTAYHCDVQWSNGTTCDQVEKRPGVAVHRRVVQMENYLVQERNSGEVRDAALKRIVTEDAELLNLLGQGPSLIVNATDENEPVGEDGYPEVWRDDR